MRELLSIIPYWHKKSQIDFRFNNDKVWNNQVQDSKFVQDKIFEKFLDRRRFVWPDDGVLFGEPNLLLDSVRCKNCGLCLTGCPYGALFDPGEEFSRMVLSGKISRQNVIKGILKKIYPTKSGVKIIYLSDGNQLSGYFDEIILATGPLSTAIILMNSNLLPKKFEIPDSQVFYGAFMSMKRFQSKISKQELAQMISYPMEGQENDFQISFYSPSEISRLKMSQIIFGAKNKLFKVPKLLSERIVPIIGFLPQEQSGKLVLQYTPDGLMVTRSESLETKKFVNESIQNIIKPLKEIGLVNLPFATRIPPPGAGFHIGASLPLGGKYLNRESYLNEFSNVRIMDASILPRIPAGAHTFFTMALVRTLMKN